jgi:hypothetical protein
VSYASALDAYNNGEFGPEHCSDETVVPPPPQ